MLNALKDGSIYLLFAMFLIAIFIFNLPYLSSSGIDRVGKIKSYRQSSEEREEREKRQKEGQEGKPQFCRRESVLFHHGLI